MNFATIVEQDRPRPVLVKDGRMLDLGSIAASLQALLDMGPAGIDTVRQLDLAATDADWREIGGTAFAVPIARPGKFVCVGLNFRDHAAEGGHAIPDYPALFMRSATSLVAHDAPIIRPRVSTKLDYEAELVVVIGSRVKNVSQDEALDAVFGYTVFNDVSVRDYQRKSAQWTAGKNFDGTGPVGPVIVSADAVPPGASGLRISCTVNGETLQDGSNTDDMIFPVAQIVSILSEFMTLEPGDHIAMGTPAGVGFARTPPVWLKHGDTVDTVIEGIGHLTNTVHDEEHGQ